MTAANVDRDSAGRAVLASLDPAQTARIEAALADISPDMADMAIGFAFGEIHARPGLSLRDRELTAIASLAALSHPRRQLKVHIGDAVGAGARPQEIVSTLPQTIVYAGFPAAFNAMLIAREVVAERDLLPLKKEN